MAYLHRAETWRHPETKTRAVLWPYISGRLTGATTDYFLHRARLSYTSRTHASAQDARESLRAAGFKHEAGKAR